MAVGSGDWLGDWLIVIQMQISINHQQNTLQRQRWLNQQSKATTELSREWRAKEKTAGKQKVRQ